MSRKKKAGQTAGTAPVVEFERWFENHTYLEVKKLSLISTPCEDWYAGSVFVMAIWTKAACVAMPISLCG